MNKLYLVNKALKVNLNDRSALFLLEIR